VAVVEVVLGELDVEADHFHGAVAKEGLEDVAISAVAQELDGEGVAEAVGVGIDDAGAAAEAGDETEEGVAADGQAALGEEDAARLRI